MKSILKQLQEYLDNTPQEVLDKEWKDKSYLNDIGPTVDEYIEFANKQRRVG